jgi:uncharacterized membrane protein
MYKQLLSKIKPLLKSLFAIGLVLTLVLGNADGALAARSGGRIGGGSFRAPARSYSSPSRTYAPREGVTTRAAALAAASVSRSCCRFLALGAGLAACSRF